MKRTSPLHLVWALLAITGCVFGYWLGSLERADSSTLQPPSKKEDPGIPASESPRVSYSAAVVTEPPRDSTASVSPWAPEELRARSFQLIAEPSTRVGKITQLSALLAQVTPENWKTVLDGVESGMKAKGSAGGELYSILLEHIAAIGGAAALEHAISPDRVGDRGRTFTMLKGWADAKPRECMAWYLAQPDAVQNAYWGHFVAGVGRSDPKAAIELTFAGKKPVFGNGTGTAVLNNAFVTLGADGLEDAFTSLRSRNDVSGAAKKEYFRNLTNKQVASAGTSLDRGERLLRWFNGHVGQPYVTSAQSAQVFETAAQSNAPATLSWLETNSGRIDEATSAAGYSALGREWQTRTPEKVSEWTQSHADHPQHDTVLEAAATTLSGTNQVDAAVRLAESIHDEARRSRLITTLRPPVAPTSAPQ